MFRCHANVVKLFFHLLINALPPIKTFLKSFIKFKFKYDCFRQISKNAEKIQTRKRFIYVTIENRMIYEYRFDRIMYDKYFTLIYNNDFLLAV